MHEWKRTKTSFCRFGFIFDVVNLHRATGFRLEANRVIVYDPSFGWDRFVFRTHQSLSNVKTNFAHTPCGTAATHSNLRSAQSLKGHGIFMCLWIRSACRGTRGIPWKIIPSSWVVIVRGHKTDYFTRRSFPVARTRRNASPNCRRTFAAEFPAGPSSSPRATFVIRLLRVEK